MASGLEIRDGNPWYLSNDIWIVSGQDPNGPHVNPVEGVPGYVCALVNNRDSATAQDVRVEFFWADPSTVPTRTSSIFIGVARVDLPGNQATAVRCPVEWWPTIVNGGHECLIVVADGPGHPLVPPPTDDAFHPKLYDAVAQRNISVVSLANGPKILAVTVGALAERKNVIVAVDESVRLDDKVLAGLGLKGYDLAADGAIEVGLNRDSACVGDDEPLTVRALDLEIGRGTLKGAFVAIRKRELRPGTYRVVHITERYAGSDEVVGGLAVVVVADDRHAR